MQAIPMPEPKPRGHSPQTRQKAVQMLVEPTPSCAHVLRRWREEYVASCARHLLSWTSDAGSKIDYLIHAKQDGVGSGDRVPFKSWLTDTFAQTDIPSGELSSQSSSRSAWQVYSVEANNAELRCFVSQLSARRASIALFVHCWNARQLFRQRCPRVSSYHSEFEQSLARGGIRAML